MISVGFIGVGLMGKHMAKHLLDAGYNLTVCDVSKENAKDLLAAGAKWVDTPKLVGEVSDVVITMLPNSKISKNVSCGQNGILEGVHEDFTLIDMSSIDPSVSKEIAKYAKEKGVPMLDAPVTGNPEVAAAGKLGIMIGGPQKTFDKCLPLFQKMGKKIVYVGENGMGTTLKLINNLILGVSIEAISEAFVLAAKAGINPEKVIEITSVGGARTGAMETRGPHMIKRDFSPRFSTSNMYKDLTTAVNFANECGVTIPATTISWEILRSAMAQGKEKLDSCCVMTILEELANTRVAI